MNDKTRIRLDLAAQGLYWVARCMDLRTDKAWDALMAVANCIAEKYPDGKGELLDALMRVEEVKG